MVRKWVHNFKLRVMICRTLYPLRRVCAGEAVNGKEVLDKKWRTKARQLQETLERTLAELERVNLLEKISLVSADTVDNPFK